MAPVETTPEGGAGETAKSSENTQVSDASDTSDPLPLGASKAAPEPIPEASDAATSRATKSGNSGNTADSRAGGARAVDEENNLYDFEYSYPAEAGNVPTLRARLDNELEKERKLLKADALEARADAADNGFPYNAYSTNISWKLASALPDWLSLSRLEWTYAGGAHGNSVFGSMVWDKSKDRMVAPSSMFKSPKALTAAVREPFCKALNQQRAKKRGARVDAGSDEMFSECIDPMNSSALVPVSSNRRTFDRLTFLIPPYAAGPYVEGSYEVTLPVTQAVLDAVKPEYSAVFKKRR